MGVTLNPGIRHARKGQVVASMTYPPQHSLQPFGCLHMLDGSTSTGSSKYSQYDGHISTLVTLLAFIPCVKNRPRSV